VAQVQVTINGRQYAITCDNGQEAHLTRLGGYVDKRLGELVAAVGPDIGDAHLLVMVSLMIADELADIQADMDSLKASNEGIAARLEAEEKLSARMEKTALRIDDVAERLDRS
jgi:cell division protein ZapA